MLESSVGRESEVLRQILLACSRMRRPDGSAVCVLWRQQVGTFRAPAGHAVKIGIEGQADIGGVLYTGRAIQIEVKSARGRMREAQARWAEMCRQMGVLYVLARSVDDVTRAIGDAG